MLKFFNLHWQMILIAAAIIGGWDLFIIFPIKILIVFLHELSHGLAAILTGGSWESFSLVAQQGGHAITRGGSRFIILSAGYLGSLFFGVVLFLTALRTNLDRYVLGSLGVVLVGIAIFYTRDLFPLFFCVVLGLTMVLISWLGPNILSDLLLRVFGLVSMIYVPYDIFSDTLARSHLRSDARLLAEYVGGSTIFWGGLWLLISVGVIFGVMRLCLQKESNIILFGRWR